MTPQNRILPGLYLVATPIGNLGDMTLRALETLRAADLVLCEDTRVTGQLLRHYDLHKPLHVYNDQSEGTDHHRVIEKIQGGSVIALVSDAGMPLLSDPGYQLVQAATAAGVMVTSVPGPSAILAALQLSGLPTDAFLFVGFLPTKAAERGTRLRELAAVPATLILFERAARVSDLLADVQTTLGDRRVAVVREITKLFEETRRGNIAEVLASLTENPIKGEVVVLIDRAAPQAIDDDDITALLAVHLADKTLRAAVDDVTALTGAPRRHVYDLALKYRDGQG